MRLVDILRDCLGLLPRGARVLEDDTGCVVAIQVTTTDGRRTTCQATGKTRREALHNAQALALRFTAPGYKSPQPTFAFDCKWFGANRQGQTEWTCAECGKREQGKRLPDGVLKPAFWYRLQIGMWEYGEGFSCTECFWLHTTAWQKYREPPRWMTKAQQAAFLVAHPCAERG